MSSTGTSRSNCVQGLEHGNAHRQREIYELLKEQGPLTAKEVAEAVGIERDGARNPLKKLRRDGYVQVRPDLELPSRHLYEVAQDE